MSEKSDNIKGIAEQALNSQSILEENISYLSGASRRARQNAAAVLAQVSRLNPELLVPFVDEFVDALNRPEAQTRWEALDVLTALVPYDSRGCDKALSGAETALFDEDNGLLRLAAVRFLCKLGATTENRSEKIWPLLDEAIQCYHGDYEYQDMLNAIISFSEGTLSQAVKDGLKERVTFDAENSKGALQRRSQLIIDNLEK